MATSAPSSSAPATPSLRRYAWLSIAAAVATIALKSLAYWATGSVGLLSDALESLVNLVAAIVALVVLHIAESPPDDEHEWGHEKVEYFASAFEGAAILAAAVAIMFTAVPRLLDPRPLEAVGVGLVVSCAASLVNLVVARILLAAGKRHRSITLEADGHHLMTDVWTSVGVVVGVGLVTITKLPVLDAVVAILLALNIVWTGWKLLLRSAMGLLDASVGKEERAAIEAVLKTFADSEGIEWHALRTRQSGSRRFIAVHVLVPGKWNVKKGHDLCERIERDLRATAPKTTVMTHLEPLEDDISQHDKGLDRDSDLPPEDRGVVALALLAALASPSLARADQPAFFDAEASLTAASNMAAIRGGGAAWYNPAGLHTELNQLDLTASAFVLRVRDFSRTIVAELPSGEKELESESVTILPVPSALVYQRRINEELTAALGIFVTQAESYDLAANLEARETFEGRNEPVSLDGRGDISLQRQTYRIGPALSWAPTPRVRLGFSALVLYDSLRDASTLRIIGADANGTMEARSSFRRRLTSFGGQAVVGAQWEIFDRVHAGMTLRSPIIAFGQTGDIVQDASAFSSGTSFPGEAFVFSDRPSLEEAAGSLLAPPELVFGVAYRGERLLLGAEGELMPALSRSQPAVSQKTQGNVRVGGRFAIDESYAIGLGVFTDRTPKDDLFFTGDHSIDYYGFAGGFQWRTSYPILNKTAAGIEERKLTFENTVAVRYAAGVGELVAIHYIPRTGSFAELSHLQGTQENVLFHALTLQLSSSLGF